MTKQTWRNYIHPANNKLVAIPSCRITIKTNESKTIITNNIVHMIIESKY